MIIMSLDEYLLSCEGLGEGLDNDRCGEAEEETEGDRDRESGKSLARHSQQEQSQAQALKSAIMSQHVIENRLCLTYDKNCYKAGYCCVPIAI
jgi:hypothetical protein